MAGRDLGVWWVMADKCSLYSYTRCRKPFFFSRGEVLDPLKTCTSISLHLSRGVHLVASTAGDINAALKRDGIFVDRKLDSGNDAKNLSNAQGADLCIVSHSRRRLRRRWGDFEKLWRSSARHPEVCGSSLSSPYAFVLPANSLGR